MHYRPPRCPHPPALPLPATAERYLGALDSAERATAEHDHETLLSNGTPAYREHYQAPLAIVIPVAGEQEAQTIGHTLLQYAQQRDAPAYSLTLDINYSELAHTRDVDKTVAAVRAFAEQHPTVPLAWLARVTDSEDTIGLKRRLATNSRFPAWRTSSHQDALIINHDADTLKLHPRYLERMWRTYLKAGSSAHIISSEVRHARSKLYSPNNPKPNMDAVVAWNDLCTLLTNGFYELGTAIPASTYEQVGGIDAARGLGEVLDVVRRAQHGQEINHPQWRRVPGSYLYTSPRRQYYKLYMTMGSPIETFWDEQLEEFDDYRQSRQELRDISAAVAERNITEGKQLRLHTARRYMHLGCSPQDALRRAHRAVDIGTQLIRRTISS